MWLCNFQIQKLLILDLDLTNSNFWWLKWQCKTAEHPLVTVNFTVRTQEFTGRLQKTPHSNCAAILLNKFRFCLLTEKLGRIYNGIRIRIYNRIRIRICIRLGSGARFIMEKDQGPNYNINYYYNVFLRWLMSERKFKHWKTFRGFLSCVYSGMFFQY